MQSQLEKSSIEIFTIFYLSTIIQWIHHKNSINRFELLETLCCVLANFLAGQWNSLCEYPHTILSFKIFVVITQIIITEPFFCTVIQILSAQNLKFYPLHSLFYVIYLNSYKFFIHNIQFFILKNERTNKTEQNASYWTAC